ncbi:hypothetical protein BHN96_001994 [Escherichia coli]|nr:hypothetical protein [Escherichia coli]EFL6830322.1 hypothetical protein [Escherichia coli]EGD4701081.1 hypothetical protein [Escherichia coli]EHE8728544.1 hypothetical protein [Escherichia coli]EIL3098301.1 hypothetical protein [Escherichia coli]
MRFYFYSQAVDESSVTR